MIRLPPDEFKRLIDGHAAFKRLVASSARKCGGMAEAERAHGRIMACVQGHGRVHSGRTVSEADRCGGAANARG
eukprot:7481195-Pyramimonas_sp.AAC.1